MKTAMVLASLWLASAALADNRDSHVVSPIEAVIQSPDRNPNDCCPVVTCGQCLAGTQKCTVVDCNGKVSDRFEQDCQS